jgi:hypothetical protein
MSSLNEMREKDEREGGEGGWQSVEAKRPRRRKGFVHKLATDITSYFFTNFPEEVTVMDLWTEFGRLGSVGEVYIPAKLDKLGRRFGFVKYREVRDAAELLAWMGDIWFGSFKLRVNIARFGKGEARREQEVTPPVNNKVAEDSGDARHSFKDALVPGEIPTAVQMVRGDVQRAQEVIWEVEVEPEKMSMLKETFVGFLAESHDHSIIQNNFIMDGYSNVRVIPFGHMKVLIYSTVEGEVAGLVGSVGWWCTVFDRFEAWSPEMVSNQRSTWLRCYGVPHHAWGVALFRTLGFKFGTFVGVDSSTLNLTRGDLARINIVTDKKDVIDSYLSVSVLGKVFVIRVVEEVGGDADGGDIRRCCGNCDRWREEASVRGSVEGGSEVAAAVGLSEEGSDDDWSVVGRRTPGVVCHALGKGQYEDTRLEGIQGFVLADKDPNYLGNILNTTTTKVNVDVEANLELSDANRGDRDNSSVSQRMLVRESCIPISSRDHHRKEGIRLTASADGGKRIGGLCSIGPDVVRPMSLRTRSGDRPLVGFDKQVGVSLQGGRGVINRLGSDTPLGSDSSIPSQDPIESFSNEEVGATQESEMELLPGSPGRCRKRSKNKKKQQLYYHGAKFLKIHESLKKRGMAALKKKLNKHGSKKVRRSKSKGSDQICSAKSDGVDSVRDSNGIMLEVVISSGEALRSTATSPMGVGGGPGVREQGGEVRCSSASSPVPRGGSVDRDRMQAEHVIDILEDVGMMLNGEREEVVNRIVKCEERDRSELLAWEQRQVI